MRKRGLIPLACNRGSTKNPQHKAKRNAHVSAGVSTFYFSRVVKNLVDFCYRKILKRNANILYMFFYCFISSSIFWVCYKYKDSMKNPNAFAENIVPVQPPCQYPEKTKKSPNQKSILYIHIGLVDFKCVYRDIDT